MYHVSAQGVDERMINVHYYITIIIIAVIKCTPPPPRPPTALELLYNKWGIALQPHVWAGPILPRFISLLKSLSRKTDGSNDIVMTC